MSKQQQQKQRGYVLYEKRVHEEVINGGDDDEDADSAVVENKMTTFSAVSCRPLSFVLVRFLTFLIRRATTTVSCSWENSKTLKSHMMVLLTKTANHTEKVSRLLRSRPFLAVCLTDLTSK
jgi:hypothetical protein